VIQWQQTKARYVLELTATPIRRDVIRRDGHQPIIHMPCGSVRHTATKSEVTPSQLEVWPQYLPTPEMPDGILVQTLFQIGRAFSADQIENNLR